MKDEEKPKSVGIKSLYKKLFCFFLMGMLGTLGLSTCPKLISSCSNFLVFLGFTIELFIVIPGFYFIIKFLRR